MKSRIVGKLKEYVGNKSAIRRFADDHGLVQFGSIGRDDETRFVKGVTTSLTQKDSHYMVGTTYGRDVIFVQRFDSLLSHTKRTKESYKWNILLLDLNAVSLPHIIITGRGRYRDNFQAALNMKIRDLAELPNGFLSGYDPLYPERFSTRLSAATAHIFHSLITPERAAILAHHFAAFDYEIQDDSLYIYLLSANPSAKQLDDMVNAGVWLAGELDGSQPFTTSQQQNNS